MCGRCRIVRCTRPQKRVVCRYFILKKVKEFKSLITENAQPNAQPDAQVYPLFCPKVAKRNVYKTQK